MNALKTLESAAAVAAAAENFRRRLNSMDTLPFPVDGRSVLR